MTDIRSIDPTVTFVRDDGGRSAAGFKNKATVGDCVPRAVAIASGRPYAEVYAALAEGNASQRITKHSAVRGKPGARTASHGIWTKRKWFKDYMVSLGFRWVPTMEVGQGCKVHLCAEELPAGRLVLKLSKHYTTMIDGLIRDAYDPRRGGFIETKPGEAERVVAESRCVYGYWILEEKST
jgi:hypothetical protein